MHASFGRVVCRGGPYRGVRRRGEMIVNRLCITDPRTTAGGVPIVVDGDRQLGDLVCLYYSTRKRQFNCSAVLY